ncbi:peptidase M23 [Sphingomonas sp. Leaf17]|uniref:M23 family metallopeptidase n=1 Tax=Sphingomonas sp. Leaf17 TaxID=1735683 RepID=UPI000700A690|nr:M23 family metallopeptidase [Sphingomonas sp. Leaf17]KQM64869.1 peptidase M23 [Sphingomonas sp. Leaf17]
MNRVGWIILGIIVVVVGLFVSMTDFGVAGGGRVAPRFDPVASVVERVQPTVRALTVPVAGVPRDAIGDSWGDAREGGARAHHGTDIMAPAGTPVVAAAAGTVEKLFQSERGGTTVYVRSPARRWTYYYAHLAGYAAGLHEGQAVKRGTLLGYVGDTGDAGAGNYHLHFGLTRTDPGERWWQGQDINPYPLLAGKGAGR